jgi:hypothetical protein
VIESVEESRYWRSRLLVELRRKTIERKNSTAVSICTL